MSVLDRKLLRDLWRLKTQVLAIALVMAAGAATLILGVGAERSLSETQQAYYERDRFADIFAAVRRAPEALGERIAEISGVAEVETRIIETAVLDIEGLAEPASGQLVSLPDYTESVLNRVQLRQGRMPDPGYPDEVVVNVAFADAHGFEPGARFTAVINGRQRELEIVGIGYSPEFIYALGPWDLIPDDRRFAVIWMSRRALAAAFDLEGAFSAVAVRLLHGASQDEVIERIDELLERYGSRGAHGRDEQTSHAFVDAEIQQIEAMSRALPPMFLFIAAFLVNITLARLVALEREQIGLMKAVGYSSYAIAAHYLKFVAAIAVIGVGIGAVIGTVLGRAMTVLLADFFHFPFLVFDTSVDTYVIAAAITIAASVVGGLKAVHGAATLAPAVAMQPPAPPAYRRLWTGGARLFRHVPQLAVMISRNIVRAPVRAAMTLFGVSLSTAILIAALFFLDSIEFMLDVSYFQADRQHASIDFTLERPYSAVYEATNLPGVMSAEPVRAVAVRLHSGPVEQRTMLFGKPAETELSRVLDRDHRPLRLPETGIVPTEALAEALGVGLGDFIEVELLQGHRGTVFLPVTAISQGYFGLVAFAEIGQVNRMMREGAMVTGVHIAMDEHAANELYAAIKELPMVGSIALQRVALANFRETVGELIWFSLSFFIGLGVVMAIGVVYNNARIQLSERARELASLRVLGFMRGEVSWVLLGELALLTLAAQPLGWLIGYGLSALMVEGFQTDLFRFPHVVERATYGWATIVVLVAAAASALIVRRRIDRLDLIEVLKTRE